MNEHMWKKAGEVKAFAEVGISFLKKGKDGLRDDVFSANEIEELIAANQTHRDQIDTIAEAADASDLVDTKAEKTKEKLVDLQDTYLTEEEDWEDPLELLEWSGFFHGGALVHWSLIVGASKQSGPDKLAKLADGGYKFHHEVLHAVKDSIKTLGSHA